MCISRKFAIVGIALGALGIGYTFVMQKRMERLYTFIDGGIQKLSNNMPVEISEQIVDEAINRAVAREVDKAIKAASTDVIDKARKDIQDEVKSEITKQYSDIKSSVSAEVTKQVANLDIRTLKREVKDEAKSIVIDKFNGQLDSILEDFNQNLSNVSKIYSSIADTITKKKESGPVFRLES